MCFSHLFICGILSTPILGNLTIQESESKRRGLMAHLSAQCSLCLEETPLETSSFISKRGRSVDVNRRIVYHSIETGGGYEGLASFCSIMNMPCIAKTAYYQHVETILDALELEAENDMKQAGQRLRQHILGENGDGDSDEVVDATVSFDGTWAKRGFTSLTGVVFVISMDTGEVLDYHVLSKSCQSCAVKEAQSALMVHGPKEASLLLLELCLSFQWTLGKCWITMCFQSPARVVR